MRRLLLVLGITGTLMLGGSAALAAPKDGKCVTLEEFGQVKMGMTKEGVASIFGTNGKRESVGTDAEGYTSEVRRYKVCKQAAAQVRVTYLSGDDLPEQKVGWSSEKDWAQHWQRPQPATVG